MSCDADVFYIKRGDTGPSLQYRLDPPVSTIGASVVFSMRRQAGAAVISRAPAVIGGLGPDVFLRWDWREGDTAEPGGYEAEFEMTYADGTVETWPNAGFIRVRIGEDVA